MLIKHTTEIIQEPPKSSFIVSPDDAVRSLRSIPALRAECIETMKSAEITVEQMLNRPVRRTGVRYRYPCLNPKPGENPQFLLPGGPYEIQKLHLHPSPGTKYSAGVRITVNGRVNAPDQTIVELLTDEDAGFASAYTGADEIMITAFVGWKPANIPEPIITATRLVASSLFDRGTSRTERQVDNLLQRYKLEGLSSASVV